MCRVFICIYLMKTLIECGVVLEGKKIGRHFIAYTDKRQPDYANRFLVGTT